MPTYRHGALYVVETGTHRKDLERDLKRLDDRLFFEYQLTIENEYVWCVCLQQHPDEPPVVLVEWRDSKGEPISELTTGILDRVKRLERTHEEVLQSVKEQNAKLEKQIDKRRDDAYAEIERDMIPKIEGRGRTVLQRGVHLRQARSRRRGRGEIR